MADKPQFNPNKPYTEVPVEKPAFDPGRPFNEIGKEKTLGQNLAQGAVDVGRGVDSISGAPTRSGIDKFLETWQSGDRLGAVGKGASAAKGQFLEKPELAPTGRDIAVNRLGMSEVKRFHQVYPHGDIEKKSLELQGYTADPKTGIYTSPRGGSQADSAGEIIDFIADPSIALSESVKYAGKGAKLINRGLFGIKLADNAEEVTKAAKVIGTKPTAGQLIDSNLVRTLEDVQAKSDGQVGGALLRRDLKKNKEAAQKAAEEITSDRSLKTKFESGYDFEKKYTNELAARLEPAEEIYGAWEDAMKQTGLPISKDGMLKRIKELKKEKKFSDESQAILAEAERKIGGTKKLTDEDLVAEVVHGKKFDDGSLLKSLDDLKSYRTTIGNKLKNPMLDGDQRHVLGSLYQSLSEARSDSLKKLATDTQTKEFAEEAIKQISEADKIWRESSQAVNETLMSKGRESKFGPKRTANDFFEKTPEIQRINKVLQTSDPVKIKSVQKEFPKAFETLRQAKIEEMVSRAEYNGQINYSKLTKSIDKLPPESQTLIFGEKAKEKAGALKVLIESMPPDANPSKTSFAKQIMELLNPWTQGMSAGRSAILSTITAPELGRDVFTKYGQSKTLRPAVNAATIGSKTTVDNKKRGLKIPGKSGLSLPVGE